MLGLIGCNGLFKTMTVDFCELLQIFLEVVPYLALVNCNNRSNRNPRDLSLHNIYNKHKTQKRGKSYTAFGASTVCITRLSLGSTDCFFSHWDRSLSKSVAVKSSTS